MGWQSETRAWLPLPTPVPDVLTDTVPQGHSIWVEGWKQQSLTDLHFMVNSDTACCTRSLYLSFPICDGDL